MCVSMLQARDRPLQSARGINMQRILNPSYFHKFLPFIRNRFGIDYAEVGTGARNQMNATHLQRLATDTLYFYGQYIGERICRTWHRHAGSSANEARDWHINTPEPRTDNLGVCVMSACTGYRFAWHDFGARARIRFVRHSTCRMHTSRTHSRHLARRRWCLMACTRVRIMSGTHVTRQWDQTSHARDSAQCIP